MRTFKFIYDPKVGRLGQALVSAGIVVTPGTEITRVLAYEPKEAWELFKFLRRDYRNRIGEVKMEEVKS